MTTIFEVDEDAKPEEILIKVLFHFSLLMEYQLLGLQVLVRQFVERINQAVSDLDGLVTEEGKQASKLFESFFNADTESGELNLRAASRADDIFEESLAALQGRAPIKSEPQSKTSSPKTAEATADAIPDDLLGEILEQAQNAHTARDEVWSKVSQKLEDVCRLEERLRPQIYTIIECLNFEDIQTQRIDHILNSYKLLNAGMTEFLRCGISGFTSKALLSFLEDVAKKTRESYTMVDERQIFDEVFVKHRKPNL